MEQTMWTCPRCGSTDLDHKSCPAPIGEVSVSLPTKVALLKTVLITVHELVQKEEIDSGRIKALIEDTFDRLHMCADDLPR